MRDISLHLLDIIQNSVAAKANRVNVKIYADKNMDELRISISDDGMGMDKELLEQVTNPFVTTRTTRKVGLGISLFKASAELTEGSLSIASEKGKGTALEAIFKISSIDRIPLGDIAETIVNVVLTSSDMELELLLDCEDRNFCFNTLEVKEKLGEVSIADYSVIAWIREFIDEGIKITFGGVLDEINS